MLLKRASKPHTSLWAAVTGYALGWLIDELHVKQKWTISICLGWEESFIFSF